LSAQACATREYETRKHISGSTQLLPCDLSDMQALILISLHAHDHGPSISTKIIARPDISDNNVRRNPLAPIIT
jgi:hypothetical protein